MNPIDTYSRQQNVCEQQRDSFPSKWWQGVMLTWLLLAAAFLTFGLFGYFLLLK